MDAAPDLDAVADESVAVIGGGIGGLSTACYLADAGADVTLLEKNEALGGRAGRLEADGFRFDRGPSWYLLSDVFERFFGHFGRRPEEFYSLTRLDPHYRAFWKDGDSVDLVSDLDANKDLFESYERGGAAALERCLEGVRRDSDVWMKHFVYGDRTRLRDYVDLDVLRDARGFPLLRSVRDHVGSYVGHPKLRQLLQYSLLFLGGSPTSTPAPYNLPSLVHFDTGVYYPDGGIGAVVDGVVDLGSELGVTYVTDAEVSAVEGRRGGFAVETEAGERYLADLVVSDADYAHTERDLLPPEKRQYTDAYWESREYAPSAFLLYLGVEGDVPELAHHTLVLPTDWDDHFARLVEDSAWPDDPAYYLCVPSKTDEAAAPDGHSCLSALVPVAPGLADTPDRRSRFRDRLLEDVAANAGTDLRDRVVFEESASVSEFASRYNSSRGTAFGLAHTLRQTPPFRPTNASPVVDGLYFAGADTTPGIGVPLCLVSGRLTAERIDDDV